MVQTFRDVVELWESPDAMAVALGARVEAVRKWRQRDSIPADWWLRIIETDIAKARGLTADQLASMAAARRLEAAE